MFSGRGKDSLERDQDGVVFFDFNPQNFVFILDYLRAKKIATPENPAPLPKVPEDKVKSFNDLLGYLGLVPSEKFNAHRNSTGVTLEEGDKVAVSGPRDSYVLGENIYQQGIVRLKMKLESFQSNYWMLVGVVKADIVPPDNNSRQYPGSYGWGLGWDG
jgi:hypothetical protein